MFDYSDLIGVPFREHGRDKTGFDCLGLHLYLTEKVGGQAIGCNSVFGSYAAMEGEAGQTLHQHYERIETPAPWCLVAMWNINPNYTTHVGTVLENCREFIHVLRNGSVAIERLDGAWRTKITGFYRCRSKERTS